MPPSQLRLPKKSDEKMNINDFIGTLCKQKHKNNNEHCYSYQHSQSIKQAKFGRLERSPRKRKVGCSIPSHDRP